MALTEATGLFVGAVALGFVHGIEPGHGWPVAATYGLDRTNKWLYGFAASFILGVGHLVSSIAMVGVFFYAKAYFDLAQVNEPIPIDLFSATVVVGGPVSLVAGVVLIALGVREYRHGHGSHSHDDRDRREDDDHGHAGHGHAHDHHVPDEQHGHDHGDDHDHTDEGSFARLKGFVPFGGGHSHGHGGMDDAADRGLWGIAWFAFVLGFAHEEEFEIIALCAGSTRCLELMLAYALAVIVGIVGLTLLLIAGYERYEARVERYAEYLPVFSAAVLVVMGLGFVFNVF